MIRLILFILWCCVWALLSWPLDTRDIWLGLLAALFVTSLTGDLIAGNGRPLRNPVRYIWFLYYIPVFLWECVKANIDVAYRVLNPDLPIRPGTIMVKTALKSDIALTFLANSVTLTPGTTTVDVDKYRGVLYIHLLCVEKGYDCRSGRLAVVDKFEGILKKIFE